MPDFYSETWENVGPIESKKVKNLLLSSYIVKVISLTFVILCSIFLEPLYLIGLVVVYAFGITLRQLVLERIGTFEYFFVIDRLELSIISNFGILKKKVIIPLSNIISISDDEMINEGNIAIKAIREGASIIKISFLDNNIEKNAFFTPSIYLESLIRKKQNDLL